MKRGLGISIAICCHNSESVIIKTLLYLSKQRVSLYRKWEVLLIDNNSTDLTVKKVEDLLKRNMLLRMKTKIVREDQLGVSNARLAALKYARYEVISFVDDDNLVCKEWIETVAKIMENNLKIAVCGSRNKSIKYKSTPFWFEKYKECYAIGKQALKTGDITMERGFVWGAGMSIRKSAWLEINRKGFKFILTGRIGQTKNAGEDSELCFALRLGGWRIWYENDLTLIHAINPKRMNWLELRKMFRGFGVGRQGHNPYFFAEKQINFNQHWYVQILLVTWKLVKNINHVLVSVINPREGDENILKFEHIIGQIQFLAKKRFEFDNYTSILRYNFTKR